MHSKWQQVPYYTQKAFKKPSRENVSIFVEMAQFSSITHFTAEFVLAAEVGFGYAGSVPIPVAFGTQ
jgi:hypothetical protein